jgi:carboxyl-terminal processing protease
MRLNPRRYNSTICRAASSRRLIAAVSVAALISLVGCDTKGTPPEFASSQSSDTKELGAIAGVMERVQKSYVSPVSGKQLSDNALKGILTGLDPHSDYMNAAEFARMESDMAGKFSGLGMTIEEENGLPQILAPMDGTPAAKAGIQPGDLIVQINGQSTAGLAFDDVITRLQGSIGSKVTLTIERGDRAPFDLTLARETITVPSVKSALEADKIGYARVAVFTGNTQKEMLAAISDLQQKADGHLNGFILDLRDDPGGELEPAIAVAGDFLNGGTIVTTRGREKSDNQAYTAPHAGDRIKGVQMVVLINGASASAAEIVPAALQDYHRAKLMGTRSFGKGSVQSIIPLDRGGALRLTTALYYTPNGRSIQGIGLQPDIPVSLPKNQEVSNAVAFSESDYFGAIRNPGPMQSGQTVKPPKPVPPPEVGGFAHPIKPDLIATANDAQLKAAMNYLQGNARNDKPPHVERLEGAVN